MGGDRLALLPKGTSGKPGKKLLCGVGKRKGSSSWVSEFRGHSWSGPCRSLCNPTGITKPSSANCPCRGSQDATCWGLPAQRLLSDVCDQSKKPPTVWVGSRDSHIYSSMGWPGEQGSSRHTGKSTTSALQDKQHLKTVGLSKRLTLQRCPLDTSWVLFIPTSSMEEHIHTAYIIHIS